MTGSILVVDDEILIRDLLYDFFQDQGWNIAVAESAEKALELLKSRQIDLVLADIKMPGMDGLELTSEIHQSYPKLPVVLMTGFPSVETAVAALRKKAADYITKPFNINQLYKLVLSLVAERETSQL
jgi:DNA-binding NtrC family response regulator